ncbi:MAG: hypothetical protein WCJ21_08735, partial [Planctomycetota bacterium]
MTGTPETIGADRFFTGWLPAGPPADLPQDARPQLKVNYHRPPSPGSIAHEASAGQNFFPLSPGIAFSVAALDPRPTGGCCGGRPCG